MVFPSVAAEPVDDRPSLTDSLTHSLTQQILTTLGDGSWENLCQADRRWQALRSAPASPPQVIGTSPQNLGSLDWDVIISGATLGVFVGAALAQRGWRVALVERGQLRGRVQEWNISRQELQTLVDLGLLTAAELDQAMVTEYNPGRISFGSGDDIWIRDVLNIGVDPVYLLERVKAKFLAAGGQLWEYTAFEGAIVHPDGVAVTLNVNQRSGTPDTETSQTVLRGRLLLDAMGHFSPIAAQARQGQKPDAVCLVVGTCAQGFPDNSTGDLFASFTPMAQQCQYFWEAFPAQDGRTTYLFTYVDAHPDRPSLGQLFEEYFRLLPSYQGVDLEQLTVQRALFGILPSYRRSPLSLPWDRLLPLGDSSGNQSPLSFGGFGALLRHLQRLDRGLDEALRHDCVGRGDLGLLQPYQPSLSVTWLFQRSMSVGVGQRVAPQQINQVLGAVFRVMDRSGLAVLKPFMQDVVQFPALAQTMVKVGLQNPLLVPRLLPQIGVPTLVEWLFHYLALALYTVLLPVAVGLEPWLRSGLSDGQRYRYHQWIEALRFGSGQDYHG